MLLVIRDAFSIYSQRLPIAILQFFAALHIIARYFVIPWQLFSRAVIIIEFLGVWHPLLTYVWVLESDFLDDLDARSLAFISRRRKSDS